MQGKSAVIPTIEARTAERTLTGTTIDGNGRRGVSFTRRLRTCRVNVRKWGALV